MNSGDEQATYKVTALFDGKELGTFTGKQLRAGDLNLTLSRLGQEILELAQAVN